MQAESCYQLARAFHVQVCMTFAQRDLSNASSQTATLVQNEIPKTPYNTTSTEWAFNIFPVDSIPLSCFLLSKLHVRAIYGGGVTHIYTYSLMHTQLKVFLPVTYVLVYFL